jgi:hypothetical protein
LVCVSRQLQLYSLGFSRWALHNWQRCESGHYNLRPNSSFKGGRLRRRLAQALGLRRISTVTANAAIVLLNLGAAPSAFVAAVLWHRSATVQVPYKDEPDASGIHSAAIMVGNNKDVIGTAIVQSSSSKRAAYTAAIAAALQGLALLVQSVAA